MSNKRRRPQKKARTKQTNRTTTKPTTTKPTTSARRRLDRVVTPIAATAGRVYRSAKGRPLVTGAVAVVVAFLVGLILASGGDSNQPAQAPPAAPATGDGPGITPGTGPAATAATGPATSTGLAVRSTLGDFVLVQPWADADGCPSVAQWEERTARGELAECTLFAIPQALGTLTPGTHLAFLGYQSGGGLEALVLLPDGPHGACAAGTVVSVPVDDNWRAMLRALNRAPASGARPAIAVPSTLRCAAGAAR